MDESGIKIDSINEQHQEVPVQESCETPAEEIKDEQEKTPSSETTENSGCFFRQNRQTLINIALALAVIVLFCLHFLCPKSCTVPSATNLPAVVTDSTGKAVAAAPAIAYVQTDSLMERYEFSKESQSKLEAQQQKAKAEIERQMQQLQKDVANFQQKIQTGAFLSQQSAQAEEAKLMRKKEALDNRYAQLAGQLQQSMESLNRQLIDTLNVFLEDYNRTHNYQVIFSTASHSTILYGQPAYDITDDVIKQLNERYAKSKK
ncbi:MAG: OmpH family outer membrane protein [Paludibacteraceae bacterium]|nr:OmpH family outer membrane protein [Paludibacteraceae bacterium]